MAVSANKLELLQIADAVAREKSIDRSIVISAMEDAIAKAARARYGSETDVHAEIDAKKGELRLSRHMLVVEQVENSSNQISLVDAQRANPGALRQDQAARDWLSVNDSRSPSVGSPHVLRASQSKNAVSVNFDSSPRRRQSSRKCVPRPGNSSSSNE